MKHTKGPWKIAENDSCCVVARNRHIVTAFDIDGGRSETGKGSANAKLIAAAPEMHSLLTKIRDLCTGKNPLISDEYILDELEMALEKAEGRES